MRLEIGLLALLPGPLLIAAIALGVRRVPLLCRGAAALMWLQLAVSLAACVPPARGRTLPVLHGFAIDRPAAVLLMLTTLVTAAAFTHAVGFFERELAGPHAPARQHISQFYLFAPLFLIAMYGVIAAQNLGYLWIAMEATTLLSAPLVYYHRTRTALEAAWKYLIICSVGIAFAFFGTAVIFAAAQQVGAPGAKDLHTGTLLLPALQAQAALLPRGLLRLGYIFILLGYGTKAGLFPLHSWLPDAHSEAPAPASAMLSGALLNCALLALWRVGGPMTAAGEGRLVDQTLLPMALATVVASGLFLLKQNDLKRLLAYSSMENVGVMAAAVALRSAPGFLLQAINHSLVKVALFLVAGNLLQLCGTKLLGSLRGVLSAYPVQGVCLLAGVVAAAGTPPFGSFLSEWWILSTAADTHQWATVVSLILGLAVAFVALTTRSSGVLFGAPARERSTAGSSRPLSVSLAAVPAALLLLSLYLGVALSPALVTFLRRAVL